MSRLIGRRPRIGVDVDLTVCDEVLDEWWEDLCVETGTFKKPPEGILDYDLRNYFKKELNEMTESVISGVTDGLDYWRRANVYNHLAPVENSAEVLEMLSKTFDIVFISTIKGHHHKSKYEFLQRHFPFMKGFIATKEKYLVDVDVMIDDRNKILNSFVNNRTILIKRLTPVTQCQDLEVEALEFRDWNTLPRIILENATAKELIDSVKLH